MGWLGLRQEKIAHDCAGCWFVCKAHSPVHFKSSAGDDYAIDRPKDKPDGQLFLGEAVMQPQK
jgi:hypothetical protein